MLNILEFNLSAPTARSFLKRFCKAAGGDNAITILANVRNFISNIFAHRFQVHLRAHFAGVFIPQISTVDDCCMRSELGPAHCKTRGLGNPV